MKSSKATDYVSNKTIDYLAGEMKNGHAEELAEYGGAMFRDGRSSGYASVFCGLILGGIAIKIMDLMDVKKRAKEMDSE